MKKFLFYSMPFMLLAPDGGGAGGGGEEGKDPKDTELENLRAELEAEKQKAAEAEKKLKDAEDAKLTEDERNAAAAKAEHEKTTAKIKELQAKALGIDPKYVSLIQGETTEEIEKNANLLSDMLKENSEAVEKRVKGSVARTGAPGASTEMNEAMEPKDFYRSILDSQKG